MNVWVVEETFYEEGVKSVHASEESANEHADELKRANPGGEHTGAQYIVRGPFEVKP